MDVTYLYKLNVFDYKCTLIQIIHPAFAENLLYAKHCPEQ